MTFQSVTTWHAGDFEVELRYGFFGTAEAAAAMARSGIERIFFDRHTLWLDLSNRTRAPARDGSFVVRRVRESSRVAGSHGSLSDKDFDQLPVNLEAIRNEAALKCLRIQSYGVIDEAGNQVCLLN